MKKVLLVDDEMIVRKGMKMLVDWHKFGMEVVADAPNGEEALKMMSQQPIDLVVTDIRMPLCDGIELMRKIKESFSQTKVILLTCYNDFEYVQEALEMGASGYLLKTDLEDQKLEKLLTKLQREWEYADANNMALQQLKLTAERSMPLMYEKYVRSLLSGEPEHLLEQEHFPLLDQRWIDANQLIMLIEFPRTVPAGTREVEEAFYRAVDKERAILFKFDGSVFFASIKRPAHHSGQEMLQWERGTVRSVFLCLSAICKDVNVYYSRSYNKTMLRQEVPKLMHIREYSTFYWGYGRAVHAEEIPLPPDTEECELFDWAQFKQLAILRNWDGMKEICNDTFKRIAEKKFPVRVVVSNILEAIGIVMDSIRSTSSLISLNWGTNKFEYMESVKEKETLAELMDWFHEGLDRLRERQKIYAEGVNKMMKQAIRFIEQNYFKEISLEDLSLHVGLSKSYLSSVFKKSTGMSFVDYLNDIRIRKAKELFEQTDLKIYEVAEKVGFNDPKYFTKMFKRLVGASPRTFKTERRTRGFWTSKKS